MEVKVPQNFYCEKLFFNGFFLGLCVCVLGVVDILLCLVTLEG